MAIRVAAMRIQFLPLLTSQFGRSILAAENMRQYVAIFTLMLLASTFFACSKDKRDKGKDMPDSNSGSFLLLGEADEVFSSRNYEKALASYEKVLEAARSEMNRSVEVEALSQVARMNLILGNKE
ncbi:MAG: hypothetical protein V3T31_12480, partial [candidate division Zixibacteria bacterium]